MKEPGAHHAENGDGMPSPIARGSGGPTRVLYVEVNEDGTVGGSHQALFDLVKGLDRERFEPVVLFYQENSFSDRLRELGVEVHDYETEREQEVEVRLRGGAVSKTFDIVVGAIRRRAQFLRRHSIGLLHLNNSPALGFDDWLPAAAVTRIPCVVSVMSVAPAKVSFLGRSLMRRFDAVMPVSQFIRDNWAGAGILPDQMRVVHHGVDVEAFRSRVTRDARDVREELGVPPERVLAVMVGNVREWKGQHVVLEALALLDESERDGLFTAFAGGAGDHDQEYANHLRELVRRHDLDRCVSFLGPRNDVPDLLNAADIAIHASVRPEPGGIAVLEAMTLGTPVVAAEVGGHAEVLTTESGFTFDTSDPRALAGHLARLLESESLRLRLGAGGRKRMEEFTIERNVRETQDVYDTVLGRNERRRA